MTPRRGLDPPQTSPLRQGLVDTVEPTLAVPVVKPEYPEETDFNLYYLLTV